MSIRSRVAALSAVVAFAAQAAASVPTLVGYQGRLLRADGTAATGTATVVFLVYDAPTGGSMLWSEAQTLGLSDGYYATYLGLATAPPEGLYDAGPRWLELRVGIETLAPRQQIGSVPFAVSARDVRGGVADVSSLQVGGQTVVDASGRLAGTARYSAGPGLAMDATQTISLQSCATGESLVRDASGWHCDAHTSGTVTAVSASAPLSIENPTTAPQITLAQAGSTSSGFLSSVDWASFNAKYGALSQCGGDLGGTLAAPAVVRLQSRAVSAVQPQGGQVLKWNAATTVWEPEADANSGGTVTRVTVDAPLTAYDGSTTPHVSIAAAGTNADGFLTAADWNRFDAKIDASTQCVGDLAGEYASPIVARIQGVPVVSAIPIAAQVLRFDGSRWAPAALGIADVGGLSSGYLDLTGTQSIAGAKSFTAAPTFGTPLAVASGGTGATLAQANTFFAGPAGGPGAPAFRTIATADLAGLGPGLTGLDAGALASGTVPDARLAGTYSSALTLNNASNSFTGNGAGLTSLDAASISTGTLPDARLAGSYSSALTLNNASNAFTGSGAGLTSLDAGALASGTVPGARLAGTYASAVTFSNAGNSFTGIGSGISELNAGALSAGTVPDARIAGSYSSAVAFGNVGNAFAGTFTGTLNGTLNGTVVASDSNSTQAGAIRYKDGHFQGFDGTRWLNLDNIPPPIIDSISPNYGTTAGSTSITITGSNFLTLATVLIGTQTCTSVNVPATTTVTCSTPANSNANVALDVKLTNTDGQSVTKAGAFTYHRPPTVSGATPTYISTVGGMTVTINGTDFVNTPSNPAVVFNSTPATSVSWVSATQLTAVAPALGTGAVTLRVTNPDGLYATGSGPNVLVFIAATGGSVTTDGSGYKIHTFTTTGNSTFTPQGSGSVEVLVVAGGGGGGWDVGGGGGGGGVLYTGSYTVTGGQAITVTVGGGGSGATAPSYVAAQGSNSVFGTVTAIGGGAGGGWSNRAPGSGGSGGGNDSCGTTAGSGTAGQGYRGGYGAGNCGSANDYSGAAGGGGAGGVGCNGSNTTGWTLSTTIACGGPGAQYSISGTATYYGGGGGGASDTVCYTGKGGIGGGGDGDGYNGTANTGGGGGGGCVKHLGTNDGGSGGSGIVIVRYQR